MIGVMCAVCNRFNPLKVSLNSWLISKSVKEIVIVDWCSSQPIYDLVNLDERISIVRVENESSFHLAGAFNLASDFINQPILLKLDADYIINPFYSDLSFCAPADQQFITGHFQHGGPFFSYLNGLISIKTEHWRLVNGYNENLVGYGWDDDDLYFRLQKLGLNRSILDPTKAKIFHIPHEDNERTANYSEKDKSISYYYNRKFSSDNPYSKRLFKWDVEKIEKNIFFAKKQIL